MEYCFVSPYAPIQSFDTRYATVGTSALEFCPLNPSRIIPVGGVETPAFHPRTAESGATTQTRKREVKPARLHPAAPTVGERGIPRPSLQHCKFLVHHCCRALCSFLWLDTTQSPNQTCFVVCHCHTAALCVRMVTTACHGRSCFRVTNWYIPLSW